MIVISEYTWSADYFWYSFGCGLSVEAKDDWTFSHCFHGISFALMFTCMFTECVTYIMKYVSSTGIIMNFGILQDIFFEMCSWVNCELLRRLRFSVALSGCKQNKTVHGEIHQWHGHLNLPLDQKFHFLRHITILK